MDFIQALKKRQAAGCMPVIADIKRRSPKEGELLSGRNPADVAKALVAAGAPALSVVTEEKSFGGSADMLRSICKSVNVPILRKDFIRSEDEIAATVDMGASAVLLIVAMLEEETLRRLYEKALSCGLTPLVETHSAKEIAWANTLGAALIGINNRDILALEKDRGEVSTTESLIKLVRGDAFIISESGIAAPEDVMRAGRAGANAVLVGTALLTAKDITQRYKDLSIPALRGTGANEG